MPHGDEITQLLKRWQQDRDRDAEQSLFSLLDRELRQMAERALGTDDRLARTIDPRELVNDAYIRLQGYQIATTSRATFFVLVAKVMRHCLVDIIRARDAMKRPSTRLRVSDTNVMNAVAAEPEVGLLEFYLAIDALAAVNARQAKVIELRVLGLHNEEIANELNVDVSTVKRDVAHARAFLAFQLKLPSNWIQG